MDLSLNKAGACVHCKRRKIKCVGNPCSYCSKKGFTCEFVDAKKRGPPLKKLKTILNEIQKVQSGFDITLQEQLANLYQQRNIVQLYFNTVGAPIPQDLRSINLEGTPKNNKAKCQLFIISSHVLKSLGQIELASKYNKAAQSVSPQLFSCCNLEDAMALIMMVLYLGLDDPQSWFYSSTAVNILKILPKTPQTYKASSFANGMMEISSPSHNSWQDREFALLRSLPTAMSHNGTTISVLEWFVICEVRIGIYQTTLLHFYFSLEKFVDTFLSAPIISQDEIEEFQRAIKSLEDLQIYDDMADKLPTLSFLLHFNNFLLSWRIGDIPAATNYVVCAIKFFKEIRFAIGLLIPLPKLLTMPYYLHHIAGIATVAQEAFNIISEVMVHQGRSDHFTHFCNTVNSQLSSPFSAQTMLQINISELLLTDMPLDLSEFDLPDVNDEGNELLDFMM